VLTLKEVTSLVHPADLITVRQNIERLIRKGEKYDFCHRFISPGSGKIRYLHVHAEPVMSPNGRVDRILGASQDITERVAIEVALKLNEARYRLIVESAQEGILLLDTDGICTLSNPKMTALLGYPVEEIQGRRLADFMNEEWRTIAEHALGSHLVKGATRHSIRLRRKDGSELWAKIVFSPMSQDAATAGSVRVMVTDVTERMRLEQLLLNQIRHLEEIDHRKDAFLAQLGHELRSPLAPLTITAHMLKTGSYDEKELAQLYESIDRQTQHLSRLADDLFDVSRLGRSVIQLQKKTLPLRPLIEQAVQISLPHIQGNGHHLDLKFTEAPLSIVGDEIRLVQVFTNLLNNAAKFTPPGGHITVTLQRHGNEAAILVRDDGVGIQPEQMHRVFELFAQVNQPAAQGNDGLGIGLYLAHQLVGLHGGRLEVNSDGQGKGSEFVIHLPLAAMPESVPTPSVKSLT
jgi:PAS domain S-box-containing protein